jgi:hydroxymethylpyrimidine/phosphomethylpyrimidine kinase
MSNTNVALTIAGSDSGGGAGIEADIRTFSALGMHPTCAVTCITSQNTMGLQDSMEVPLSHISSQIDAVCTDMDIKWAKTGMLSSPEIIAAVASEVKKHRLKLVVDPVMTAEAGGTLLAESALSILKETLLPLAFVVTPNIYEAKALSGVTINTWEDGQKAARRIAKLGVDNVIITGGHFDASDLVYESHNDTFTTISSRFVKGGTHGSGCTYSAALLVYLSNGLRVPEAARCAKRFVENAIARSTDVGMGVSPVDPLAFLRNSAAKYHTLVNTTEALDILLSEKTFSKLIPEVGCNIAMATPEAETISDVAGVHGRITRSKGRPVASGCVGFGASKHVGSVVLAAIHSNPEIRACLNVKYSKEILAACSQMGFGIASFERKDEPSDVSTMDWGTAHAIERYGKVPEVIYDEGDVGKEPMIRLLGKSATDVVEMALKIVERIN